MGEDEEGEEEGAAEVFPPGEGHFVRHAVGAEGPGV